MSAINFSILFLGATKATPFYKIAWTRRISSWKPIATGRLGAKIKIEKLDFPEGVRLVLGLFPKKQVLSFGVYEGEKVPCALELDLTTGQLMVRDPEYKRGLAILFPFHSTLEAATRPMGQIYYEYLQLFFHSLEIVTNQGYGATNVLRKPENLTSAQALQLVNSLKEHLVKVFCLKVE